VIFIRGPKIVFPQTTASDHLKIALLPEGKSSFIVFICYLTIPDMDMNLTNIPGRKVTDHSPAPSLA
jgi:hypothetical protein